MKRLFSFILALTLIMSFAPYPALATTPNSTDGMNRTPEEIIELACEIWPDRADCIINGGSDNGNTRSFSNGIVLRDKVVISENETLEYIQFANGTYALENAYWELTSSSGTSRTGRYTVVNIDGSCILSNFQFTASGYDAITNTGNTVCYYAAFTPHKNNILTGTATQNPVYTFDVFLYDKDFTPSAQCMVTLEIVSGVMNARSSWVYY